MTTGSFVIDIGGVQAFSSVPSLAEYLLVEPEGFDGWRDTPQPRLNQVDIPNGHGQFDLPMYLSSRVISISGHGFARNHGDLAEMGNRLKMLGTRDPVTITVTENGQSLYAVARQGAPVKWREYSGEPCAEFHAQFWCADPLKYGAVNQFSMASDGAYLNIYHRGNFEAYPRVVISGSAANGYELMHPSGAVYQVDKPLVTGVSHEVDMRTGLLRVGGVVDMDGVTGASVWHVPPGDYHQMKVRPLSGGTATAVCYVTDTYI